MIIVLYINLSRRINKLIYTICWVKFVCNPHTTKNIKYLYRLEISWSQEIDLWRRNRWRDWFPLNLMCYHFSIQVLHIPNFKFVDLTNLKISRYRILFWDESTYERTYKSESKVLCIQFNLEVAYRLGHIVLKIWCYQKMVLRLWTDERTVCHCTQNVYLYLWSFLTSLKIISYKGIVVFLSCKNFFKL